MALPTLTPEQRTDALAKAAAARARRAEVKAALKGGSMRLSAFLEQADQEEVLGKMKALALLQSLPRVGATTARTIMEEVGISESRRVRGLGAHQRAELVRRFGSEPQPILPWGGGPPPPAHGRARGPGSWAMMVP